MTCQVAIDRNLGIPVEAFENYVPGHVEIMVDAIFGVGLSREVGGEFAEAIRFMREQEPKAVVAVDIPSGVSSETGAALGEAAEADLTVTFGYGNGVLSGTEAVRRDCDCRHRVSGVYKI